MVLLSLSYLAQLGLDDLHYQEGAARNHYEISDPLQLTGKLGILSIKSPSFRMFPFLELLNRPE
jgi:hypothetical protein